MKNVDTKEFIIVKGARENNLKNIDINIPKNKFVVITGLSGSGKSSLAFDTIYAEGQRRYLESLSSYARQFLGGNEKPDVDSIEGLSPAISIDQKTTSHNPRSTVGTATEIYDYLRLLFARVGKPFCVNGHGLISTISISQIINFIFDYDLADGHKVQILSPIIKQEKGTFKNKIEELKKQGYLRIRVNGNVCSLDDEINLDKNKKHSIDIVIDRIILNHDNPTRSRIYDAIEKALKEANGYVDVVIDDQEFQFSQNHSCKICNFSIPELEPRLFSFNSPVGACKQCDGLGFTYEPDYDKIIPDDSLSIDQGAIAYFKNVMDDPTFDLKKMYFLFKHFDINTKIPFKNLSKEAKEIVFHGTEENIEYVIENKQGRKKEAYGPIEGISDLIKRRYYETSSELAREFYNKFMSNIKCNVCLGKKLSKEALSIKIDNYDIIQLTDLNITKLNEFFMNLKLSEDDTKIANLVLKEIISRLSFLENVGLNYLTLSRTASTLSGGESQRIRLATQIGSALTGVLYVLDEPSIGLHQKDNEKLIKTLKNMRDIGNSLIVVEHDEETIRESDYLIDIGPGAGIYGGQVVAYGTVADVANNDKSITGRYLSGLEKIDIPKNRRGGNGKVIELFGAKGNNLKNINVKFPLGKLITVTGVSGSGKSTLINETFVKAIEKKIYNNFIVPSEYKAIKGIENVDKIVKVSQDPIGRTPRSNPATYISVFDDIRELFAKTIEAKARGYEKGRFSFNVKGGRCENCSGDGLIKIEMHFLPDVYVKCGVCNGKKYNEETLQVLYKGKSIYDVLEMNVTEAVDFFYENPEIKRKLDLMVDVGLHYLKLGTPSTQLSGGEAQRIKLAKYLQKKPTGKTIYVLDEPSTGLHIHDIKKLIEVLNKIVDHGDTVIIVEHNLDMIKVADYVIDLGPDGGDCGGKVIATGTPEQVAFQKDNSYTGYFLNKILK